VGARSEIPKEHFKVTDVELSVGDIIFILQSHLAAKTTFSSVCNGENQFMIFRNTSNTNVKKFFSSKSGAACDHRSKTAKLQLYVACNMSP
jgi:hypothetical protein